MRILKTLKIMLIFVLIMVFLGIVFSIFYVPSKSLEGRVRKVESVFNLDGTQNKLTQVKLVLEKIPQSKRLEIFENLSFETIKENSSWIIKVLDTDIPLWHTSNCFNTRYLLSEVKLKKERNKKISKNFSKITRKGNISDFDELLKVIENLAFTRLKIKKNSFYLIDGSLSSNLEIREEKQSIRYFKAMTFEIESFYMFEIEFKDNELTISPIDEKYEDDGSFSLQERLRFFDLNSLKKYLKKTEKLKFSNAKISLSDKIIDKNSNELKQEKKQRKDRLMPGDEIEKIELNTLTNIASFRNNIFKTDEINSYNFIGSVNFEILGGSFSVEAIENPFLPKKPKLKYEKIKKDLPKMVNVIVNTVSRRYNIFKRIN